MNKDLIELITTYATKNHDEVLVLLNEKSKSNIVSMLLDLITQYANDKNSSTLREFLVVSLSGFEPLTEKIGYNGYRHATTISGETEEYCEAKPKNITLESRGKLDGGGNFTDYTWKKLERHKDENPMMLIAGFVDGRLIYIFAFKFNHSGFISRIEKQLKDKYPDGDQEGYYLRSASFTLGAYEGAEDLSVKVFVSQDDIEQYYNDKRLTKGIRDLLIESV